MPRKEFEAFTRLDASDVNTFLMDQSVMTFASSAARGSAIPTPVEGMVTFLEDTKLTEQYANGAWKVLTPSSGNAIINGAFEINQRNFTSTTVGGFTFDRWLAEFNSTSPTYSSETFSPGDAPLADFEGTNFLRIQSSAGTASFHSTRLIHIIESVRTFANQTVTLSFFAKASSGTPFIAAHPRQIFGTGGSAIVDVDGKKVQLSTNWARYSMTFQIPSISGKTIGPSSRLVLRFWTSAGSDFDAFTDSLGLQAATIDIWGVQLEAGTVATPFRRNANSIQGELAACQRYYYRQGGEDLFQFLGIAQSTSATASLAQIFLPVRMRVPAISVEFSTLQVGDTVGTVFPVTACTLVRPSTTVVPVALTSTGTMAFQRSYSFGINNSLSGFLAFSAEL